MNQRKEGNAMTTSKTKTKLWPPIHCLTYSSGKPAWQVACQINGARIREVFPTKGEAEARAAEIRLKRDNEGYAAFNIPQSLRVEAVECSDMLRPFNASIREACRYYVEHVLKYRNAPTVAEIVEQLIADTIASGRREKTTTDLRYRLGAFSKEFGARKLSEITLPQLQEWSNAPSLSAVSRRHMLTKLSQLYRYSEKRGWCEKNIAAYISRPSIAEGEPDFLTVPQCARLLENAPDFDLLPYVVLGLFTGIRKNELERLSWEKVKLSEGVIIIDGSVAKTKSRRVIDLNDTAKAWLATCAKFAGHVVEQVNFRKRLDALRRAARFGTPGTETKKEKAAGIVLEPWPENALRHTAASYTYAISQDAVRVSAMLGNSPDVLHRHYRGLVTKADAERFFALRPDSTAANVVPMKAAANG
jgi:integrase